MHGKMKGTGAMPKRIVSLLSLVMIALLSACGSASNETSLPFASMSEEISASSIGICSSENAAIPEETLFSYNADEILCVSLSGTEIEGARYITDKNKIAAIVSLLNNFTYDESDDKDFITKASSNGSFRFIYIYLDKGEGSFYNELPEKNNVS